MEYMKKIIRFTAAALSGALIISAVVLPTGAARFDSTDSNTAVAGASASLKNYLEDGQGSVEEIAAALTQVRAAYEMPTVEEVPDETVPETVAVETEAPAEQDTDEIIYDEPKIGVANVMGVLNVRKEKTTLSDIVEFAVRGAQIEVLGEVISNHAKWYKVRVNGTEGYVAGNLVVFGDDAQKMLDIVEAESTVMPESFEIVEDLSSLEPELQERVERLAKEISFVMKVDYPTNVEKENFTNTYSVLIYMLELLTEIDEIANENGLTGLYDRVEKTIGIVEYNRQALSELTGYSEQDFIDMITDTKRRAEEEQAAAVRAAEEAQRIATEAEEAARLAQEAEAQRIAAEAAAKAAADEEARKRAEEELAAAQAAAEQAAADQAAREEAARQAQQDAEAQQAVADQAQADAAAAEEAQRQAEAEAAAQQAAQEAAAQEAVENSTGRAIADFAASWVGRINYVWGGDAFYEGGGVDCSHFTYHVFLQYGLVNGYTYSGGQRGWGTAVALENIQPGDLVCYDGHVAIYYGNGLIVHAPAPGRMIEIGNLYLAPIRAVRRLY